MPAPSIPWRHAWHRWWSRSRIALLFLVHFADEWKKSETPCFFFTCLFFKASFFWGQIYFLSWILPQYVHDLSILLFLSSRSPCPDPEWDLTVYPLDQAEHWEGGDHWPEKHIQDTGLHHHPIFLIRHSRTKPVIRKKPGFCHSDQQICDHHAVLEINNKHRLSPLFDRKKRLFRTAQSIYIPASLCSGFCVIRSIHCGIFRFRLVYTISQVQGDIPWHLLEIWLNFISLLELPDGILM